MRAFPHKHRGLAFALVLGVAALAIVLAGAATAPAKSTLSAKDLHAKHLNPNVGLECNVCHEAIEKDGGVMRVVPSLETCKPCHDDTKTLNYEPAKSSKRAIGFSHVAHKEFDKKCQDCHGAFGVGAGVGKPDHSRCVECHQEDFDQMLCAKCHMDFGGIGLTKLSSFKHANDFMGRHPEYARKNTKACTQCHTESYCLDCHNKQEDLKPSLKYPEKVRAGLIHRGDWETTHRIEAKLNQASCLKCHGTKYCTDCHTNRGIAARAETKIYQHPAGWMTKGAKDFHGEKARTETLACASCHDRGGPGDCRTCHRSSLGLNPHPKGWDPKGVKQTDRMCAECHSH